MRCRSVCLNLQLRQISSDMAMKNIIIVGAGDVDEKAWKALWNESREKNAKQQDWILIAADGGTDWLDLNGIKPDYRIGDWDSAKEKPVASKHTIVLPVKKDDTDLLAAIRLGMKQDGTVFHIFGSLGGERVDHSFASVQCLVFLKKHGCTGYIYHKQSVITLMQDERMEFPDTMEGYFSVFAVSETVQQVTIKGAAYEVADESFSIDYPIGVSNEFIGQKAEIVARGGMLAIIYPQKNAEKVLRSQFQP